jgi:ribosomal protein L29
MKKTSYIETGVQDLKKALVDKRVALRDFRFGTVGSKNKDTKAGKTIRKDIARIMTELTKHK